MAFTMNEPNENPRRYKWPWFALAAVVLFTVLAIFWVALAAKKVEQQRDFGSPLPSTTPAR
jgi:bacteriorhodopsin